MTKGTGKKEKHRIKKKERRRVMPGRIVIDGNAFYEIDEECMKKKQESSLNRKMGGNSSGVGRNGTKKDQPQRQKERTS